MQKLIITVGLAATAVAGAMAQSFTADWEQTDQALGTTLSRTMAYDPVSNQLLIADYGAPNVIVRSATDGSPGTPATLNIAGLNTSTDRNLPFFGLGASDTGVIYSFLNDTDGNATPGDGIVRWADVNAAPVEITSLGDADSAAFFPRNIEVVSANGTDYLVEVGDSDGGPIQIWSWDGSTFALADEVPGSGVIGTPPYGGKSGADIDAWPPTMAIGADVVGAAANGGHLWSFDGSWTFVGDLNPPAGVDASDPPDNITATIDVGFDTNVSCGEAPVMFAMWPPGATADTVTIAMYRFGNPDFAVARIDIPTGGANPSSGGAFCIDEVNNHIYYGWRTTTNAANFTFGRVSYTPVPAATAALDIANLSISMAATEAELEAGSSLPAGTLSLRGMGILPDGRLALIDAEGDPNSDILAVTPNPGGAPTVAQLVDGADIQAASTTGSFNVNAVRGDSQGNLWVSAFGGSANEIWYVSDPGGGSQSVASVGTSGGIVGIDPAVDGSGVYVTQTTGFGAANEDVLFVTTTGSSSSVYPEGQLPTDIGGGTDQGYSQPKVDPCSGDVIIWNESAFGGTDEYVRVVPGGSATLEIANANIPNNALRVDAFAVDSLGNIYSFPGSSDGSDPEDVVTIFTAAGGVATITYNDILAVTGDAEFECEDVAVLEAPDQISLFCANDGPQNNIVRIDFPITTTTSVDSFSLYR